MKIPSQFQLSSNQFPKDAGWAASLVSNLNQFVTQVIAALNGIPQPTYRTFVINTGNNLTDPFPIDFPSPVSPKEMRIASVSGTLDALIGQTVVWSQQPSSVIRIERIYGLVVNASATITVSFL